MLAVPHWLQATGYKLLDMQFQVPQFIEVEDKIFWSLTFKQFVYVAGGAGASYLFLRILPIYLAGPLILAVAGIAAALAFFQYNGRPFIHALEHGFFFLMSTKLYLWSNKRNGAERRSVSNERGAQVKSQVYVPKLSDSKLHELAWSLDIKEHLTQASTHEMA